MTFKHVKLPMIQHITLPMIRKVDPQLIAQQIIGVQPMDASTGELFKMKFKHLDPNIVKFYKKYNFSRAKWYIADLFNTGHNMNEVREWCTTQFGKKDKNADAWSRWTNNNNSLFRFRDEKDYIMFVLRWS
jgi:tRNA isopentenyl-2-thiomethyl-A-37 hydroxylase MiaE